MYFLACALFFYVVKKKFYHIDTVENIRYQIELKDK